MTPEPRLRDTDPNCAWCDKPIMKRVDFYYCSKPCSQMEREPAEESK